jgi:aspartate aminotransferase
MPAISARLGRIKPSPILAVVAKAAALRKQGRDIIDLSIGEPDFRTPDPICDAGVAAIRNGITGYTPTTGLPGLREAIAAKLRRENNLEYEIDEITIGTGGKQVIYNAMMATLDPGDEVVIPAPYWASYPDITQLADGRPVIVACPQNAGFKLTPEQLAAHLTPRTKWVVLNSPSNPTGATYSEHELAALAAVLRGHPDIWILSDEIYEHMVYGVAAFRSFAAIAPDLKDRTLTMNGVSKAYAMTGWRLGYAAGPVALIRAMNAVQGHSTTHPSSISQAAAMAALNGDQGHIAGNSAAYARRRDTLVAALNDIPGLSCLTPGGAFYVYPSIAGLTGSVTRDGRQLASDEDVAIFLLEAAGVAVVHGAAFGLSPHVRISYAASEAALAEAITRIRAVVEDLDTSSVSQRSATG